jgi:uncharacterized protein YndB with AHSA1/START domain
MTTNEIVVDAPPEAVFDVLLDAQAYPKWVVGAKRVRAVDPDWPAVGSRFHHTVGVGPASLDDSSQILEADPPHRLVLEVRFRPTGVARVQLDVSARGEGHSTVVLKEDPKRGPVRRFWGIFLALLMSARNTLALRRLKRLVERRAGSSPR